MRLISKKTVFMTYSIALLATIPSCTPTGVTVPPASVGQLDNPATTLLELQETPSEVPDDSSQSIDQYRNSAEKGEASGQFNLGQVYNQGLGVTVDYAQAASWYRKAAEQGHAKAQYNLGYMYALGLGVPQEMTQAYMWLTLASHQGLAKAIEVRDDLANSMTPSQIEAGQRMAREWAATHPRKGDADSIRTT